MNDRYQLDEDQCANDGTEDCVLREVQIDTDEAGEESGCHFAVEGYSFNIFV